MAEEGGEKTQEATPHHRQQAQEEGRYVQSTDLNSAALLLTSLVTLLFAGGGLLEFLGRLFFDQLGGGAWLRIDPKLFADRWTALLSGLAPVVLPLMGIVLATAVGLHLFQNGFTFLPEKVVPDFSRINPLAGFGRLFSMRSGARLLFGVLKMTVVLAVAAFALYKHRHTVLSLTGLAVPEIGSFAFEVCVWTGIKISLALLLLAILDYAFQWWQFERDLRMTPQEMREEMRNLHGDPQVLARRRAVQRQLAVSRLKAAVPKADVVITNPTELAVAIQYDHETMAAPIVVAKGAGLLAQRIRRLALEHDIPIVEKKPLAQALYREVDINRPIPDQLYATVAEVLAYVYQLKGKPVPGAKAN
jgi:flagellar biosynthesis protein FlhB